MKSAEASNTAADVMLMRLSFRDKNKSIYCDIMDFGDFLINLKKKSFFPPKSRIWPRENGNKP